MQEPDETWWKSRHMDILGYDEEVSIRTFESECTEPISWSRSANPRSAWQHLMETYTTSYTGGNVETEISNCLVELTGLSVADGLSTGVLCRLYTFLAVCSEMEEFFPFPDDGLFEDVQDYLSHITDILAQRSPLPS